MEEEHKEISYNTQLIIERTVNTAVRKAMKEYCPILGEPTTVTKHIMYMARDLGGKEGSGKGVEIMRENAKFTQGLIRIRNKIGNAFIAVFVMLITGGIAGLIWKKIAN